MRASGIATDRLRWTWVKELLLGTRSSLVEPHGPSQECGGESGGWRSTLKEVRPSVISMVWSAARSRKVWVVLLVGHETVSLVTRVASSRPIVSTRLLPP